MNTLKSSKWKVKVVRALRDNFMYLIIDCETKECCVVDGVEPPKVLAAAEEEGCTITHILTTHNHWDHAGGNDRLSELLPNVPIIGGKGDSAAAVTREVGEGDSVIVGNLKIQTIETPFHTTGHVCFFVEHDGETAVFTGDTLFVAGCGNLNAGNKSQLFTAFRKLGSLPKPTLVYVGHEYTLNNLKYALSVEPENKSLKSKFAWARECRAKDVDTVPSTIQEEFDTSPFMRAAFGLSHEVLALSGCDNNEDAILWVRQDKSGPHWMNRLSL